MSESQSKETRRLLIERRGSIRFPCDLRALCSVSGDDAGVWTAQVRNVSAKGASLLLTRSFPPGTLFAVQFLRPEGEPLVAQAEVIHCVADGDEWYHGCAFVRRLAQETVDDLAK